MTRENPRNSVLPGSILISIKSGKCFLLFLQDYVLNRIDQALKNLDYNLHTLEINK